MADVMRELERLRPVYETGVLRLLLRQNAMLYVSLLRSTFDPLTGELPRETVEERFAQSLNALADAGEYAPREDQTFAEAAHQILADLTREGEGDYAWLANSHDAASHRFLYRLTARAHRAIEALSRLEDESRALSGAQANSIIMEIEHARMQLTADPGERIKLLNREIKERKHEIKRIQQGKQHATLSEAQVEDVIAVIHNTLRGVPIDLRELVLDERDNGDALRRRMQAGDISVDENLTRYHDEYRRSFRESDSGRRFEDAFQVIITDEGRQQIDEALRAIAKTPYLAGESGVLLGQIRDELARIYDGIEAVRRQMRVSDQPARAPANRHSLPYDAHPLEPTVRAPQRGCENPYGRRLAPVRHGHLGRAVRAIADAPGQIHDPRHRTRPERPRRRSPAVDSGGRSAGHGQQRRPPTPAHGQPHPAQPGDR